MVWKIVDLFSDSQGIGPQTPTKKLIANYDLDPTTQDVIGHALCLYRDETWQDEPAAETIRRTKLYIDSLRHYGVENFEVS